MVDPSRDGALATGARRSTHSAAGEFIDDAARGHRIIQISRMDLARTQVTLEAT
ncbi:MAG: hypothetical protein ACLQBK_20635 [Candidatus Sulfotelmatobacter sp.]